MRATDKGLVVAVVLAAGESRRMGKPKQLVVVDGEPMVVRAARLALASGADEGMVVTGAHAVEVVAALAPLLATTDDRLRLVSNPDYQTGQASTIRTAVATLPPACAAVLFLPVDQPFIPPSLLRQLIDAWQAGARLAAPVVAGVPRGAPALFDRSLFPELLQLQGDIGARPLLQKYRPQLVLVPATTAELRDLDTPEDLAAAMCNP